MIGTRPLPKTHRSTKKNIKAQRNMIQFHARTGVGADPGRPRPRPVYVQRLGVGEVDSRRPPSSLCHELALPPSRQPHRTGNVAGSQAGGVTGASHRPPVATPWRVRAPRPQWLATNGAWRRRQDHRGGSGGGGGGGGDAAEPASARRCPVPRRRCRVGVKRCGRPATTATAASGHVTRRPSAWPPAPSRPT